MDVSVIKPWYREPWAWLIVGPLVFVVFLGIGLLTISIKYRDDVVRDDYYKEGKSVNNLFEAERNAKEQGISAKLILDSTENTLQLDLNQPVDSTDKIILLLSHPLKAEQDRTYVMRRVSLQGYEASIGAPLSGRWYLRVEARAESSSPLLWRLSGEVDFSLAESAQLH